MPYEYKVNKKYKGCVLTEETKDLHCAGCAERCEISMHLQVRSVFFSYACIVCGECLLV